MVTKRMIKFVKDRSKLHYVGQWKLLRSIICGKYPSRDKAPTWFIRFVMAILVLARCVSLGQIIQGCSKEEKQNDVIDLYIVLAFSLLVICLFWIPKSTFASCAATYLMLEMLVVTLAVILVNRQTEPTVRSIERSILLLAVGYLELIVGFAILYLSNNCIEFSSYNNLVNSSWDALYFSTVTITTLGFGDIRPIGQVGRIFVIFETLAGITLIVYALSTFVSSARKLHVQGEDRGEEK